MKTARSAFLPDQGSAFGLIAIKSVQYNELYKRLGNYPYDQDPARPGWAPLTPNDRWADPKDDRPVSIPY